MAYGLRPLGRLSLLTVRCVFYVTVCPFFQTALLSTDRLPASAPTADHTEMLCVWLPLLRVVLGSVPNAHLLGCLCPGGRAPWLTLATPHRPPLSLPRNNGVFWDGADGEASGSMKPLARSSISLLPIERRRAAVGRLWMVLEVGVHSRVGPALITLTAVTHTKVLSLLQKNYENVMKWHTIPIRTKTIRNNTEKERRWIIHCNATWLH